MQKMFSRKSIALYLNRYGSNCNQWSEERETKSEDCNMTMGFELYFPYPIVCYFPSARNFYY